MSEKRGNPKIFPRPLHPLCAMQISQDRQGHVGPLPPIYALLTNFSVLLDARRVIRGHLSLALTLAT